MIFDELLTLVSSQRSLRLCIDSRKVKPGDIFIALKGGMYDGHDFINCAVENGAGYIVCQSSSKVGKAKVIIVEDTTEAAGLLAQANCGNPASKLTNLAVTGTNGKTTVAFLVRSIIQTAGQSCGLISTILYDTTQQTYPAELTTPDCLTIAEKQQQMVQAGAKYMVTEASSHSLYQNRLAGIDFAAAAFTNLTGDHLDYHETRESYLAAKSILFEKLSPQATAILNEESDCSRMLAEKTKAHILWYAANKSADIAATIESMDINTTKLTLSCAGRSEQIESTLIGRYNVSNMLAAAGLCLAVGFDLKTVAEGLSALKSVPGRLEKVPFQGDFTVLVDYAHTDDALKNVLSTLKPLCDGRLIVVFGCGGDRDKTKRPRMAKATEQWADYVIVTTDNPRGEQPEAIIGEIATGFENATAAAIVFEVDRVRAIDMAVKIAKAGDIVLIAGKGHETYQIIGDRKIDFSDVAVAAESLRDLK